MATRYAARSLRRLVRARFASGSATAQLHHQRGHDQYTETRARYDEHEAQTTARSRLISELAPREIVEPHIHYELSVRWRSEKDLQSDILLSTAEKDALAPLLASHQALLERYYNRPEEKAEDDRSEALYDLVCAAEKELLATPAPTIDALVFKQQLQAREADDAKLGYDDVGLVSFLLSGYREQSDPVLIHMDLLRLGGLDHPMLHIGDFRPKAWVSAYEAAGGFVSIQDHALLLFPPDAGTDGLQATLTSAPWKYRAVQLEAERRLHEGGDPIFDHAGHTGARDSRRKPPTGPARPYQRVERIIFAKRNGGIEPIIQSLVRDGDRLIQRAPT